MQHDAVPPDPWLAVVVVRLQRQWPTIDRVQLREVAADLWRDDRLRVLPAEQAVAAWLAPVAHL